MSGALMRHVAILFLLAALPGCTTFPDVDVALAADMSGAKRPEILPIAALIAGANDARIDPETGPALQARAGALRRRARALSGPVLSRRERTRLQHAIIRLQRER